MKIPYVNLSAQWEAERSELLPIIDKALSSGQYVGGKAIEKLEQRIAELCGVNYCVTLNSGTDALVCGLVALGIRRNDEVITPPNSFVASTAAIVHIGAKPVFVDVLPDQNINPKSVEKAITTRTKAIMPVHLTGRMARMEELEAISNKYHIPLIEDAAQAIGARYQNKLAGSWGKVGCFSTHPLKNLNACGDGGFITTNDECIATCIKKMRNHGILERETVEEFGYVSRMDTIQAIILNYRLRKLNEIIHKRRELANIYIKSLNSSPVILPIEGHDEFHTYHTFVIQVEGRNRLQKELLRDGIESKVHYPIPIHQQPAFVKITTNQSKFINVEKQSKKILSLPINQYLKKNEVEYISEKIASFLNKRGTQYLYSDSTF